MTKIRTIAIGGLVTGLVALMPAQAMAADTQMANSVASLSNIVASSTCSGSVLGGSKLVLKPGQISYLFGAGMYIPTGKKAKMYRNGVYQRTVTGPYTQCAGGANWRAQLLN